MKFTIGAISSKVGLSRLMERPPRSTKLAAGGGPSIHVMSGQAIPSLVGLALGPPSLHLISLSSTIPTADAIPDAGGVASGTSSPTPQASGSDTGNLPAGSGERAT